MTAEIAIMNREAVALAADSAVTISQGGAPKIFASANKLFALSRYHPVGIMVYGNASFMEVPWETVIKRFRSRQGDTACATIQEYADSFVSFLEAELILAPEASQERYIERILSVYYARMIREVLDGVENRRRRTFATLEEGQGLFREVAANVIGWHYRLWRTAPYAENMGAAAADGLRKQYRTIIRQAKETYFGSLQTQTTSTQLTRLAGWILSKNTESPFSLGESGIVIAGFGEEQIFPSLRAIMIAGISGGKLKYQHIESKSEDISVGVRSVILSFAQGEMVRSFMEGIDPDYRTYLVRAIDELLTDYPDIIINSLSAASDREKERLIGDAAMSAQDMVEAFLKECERIEYQRYTEPVMSTVAGMPKSELPAVAEALINLQSLKRRVSQEQETVGGPIDVMLISKGDGLIWIRRKHYFDSSLNPRYFQAACKEDNDGTAGQGETE